MLLPVLPCKLPARDRQSSSVRFRTMRSGIRPAINGQISPGDERGLRTGDEGHQRGDLINMSAAVERCGGLLGHCPIARGGMQIRIDRPCLNVVDRDTVATNLSGQRLVNIFAAPAQDSLRRARCPESLPTLAGDARARAIGGPSASHKLARHLPFQSSTRLVHRGSCAFQAFFRGLRLCPAV